MAFNPTKDLRIFCLRLESNQFRVQVCPKKKLLPITVEPSKEHIELFNTVKKELEDLGLEFK